MENKKNNYFRYIIGTIISLTIGFLFYKNNTKILPWIFPDQKIFNGKFGLIVLSLFISIIIFAIILGFNGLIKYIKNENWKINVDVKDGLKKLFICLVNIICAAGIGLLLLVGVYSLPVNKINENLVKSATTLKYEDTYQIKYDWCVSELDNFTDSIMLLNAGDETKDTALNKALYVYRGQIEDKYSSDTLILHYLEGQEYTETVNYFTYWHGYLIFLKPLLTFMGYGGLRVVNLFIQIVLVLLICVLMYKREYKNFIIPYVLIYLMMGPTILGNSLQYSACFYVANIGILLLLLIKKEKLNKYAYLLFLNIGILTSYFDFLTYPYITFGFVMSFYLMINKDMLLKNKIKHFIEYGVVWVLGYLLMWGSKWVIATIITGENVLGRAISEILYRTSPVNNPILEIEAYNYVAYLMQPATLLCIIYMIYCVTKFMRNKVNNIWNIIISYSFVFIIPILWYALAKNHSFVHWWFTFKGCSLSMMAILFSFTLISNGEESE